MAKSQNLHLLFEKLFIFTAETKNGIVYLPIHVSLFDKSK